MEMSKKIKLLRQQNNMTLEEVGNLVGVGKSTVRKWENGIIANMRRDKIEKLAYALNTTPGYLMGWEDENGFAALSEKENEQTESSRTTYKDLPLTEKEKQLVEFFRQLNVKGKERMLEDAEMYTMLAMYCQKEEVE